MPVTLYIHLLKDFKTIRSHIQFFSLPYLALVLSNPVLYSVHPRLFSYLPASTEVYPLVFYQLGSRLWSSLLPILFWLHIVCPAHWSFRFLITLTMLYFMNGLSSSLFFWFSTLPFHWYKNFPFKHRQFSFYILSQCPSRSRSLN